MTENHPPATDDSYWSALFAEEIRQELPAMPSEKTMLEHGEERPFSDTQTAAWQLAQTHYENGDSITASISNYNRGGLLINWNELVGFIPASHLVNLPPLADEKAKQNALAEWVGKSVTVKIIRINPAGNQLIFSERAAQTDGSHAAHLLKTLEKGDKINGTVTNVTNFGVFVDLGGMEGLIHISELSWSRVRHPESILVMGDDVTVQVLRVERENERIALSLKQLKPDPWQTVEAKYKPDQIVTGAITHITNYGAFVLLEDELEGLIHLSELAEGTFMHPRNVVSLGETVTARVLTVDGASKRLALSMRAKNGNE